ncbi:hypothetical protein EC968_007783 [Mortierella alpina]|nr:hypothetical protein EC968_007783 [Mortierella alpina]
MTSTRQLQQDSVMDRVPIEIIQAFGQYLNGTSLLASIQVCRHWHHVLRPLLWTSISKWQFYHPQFPLHSQCTPEDIVALQRDLLQVRHIEWSYATAFYERGWRNYGKPTTPLEKLSTDKLALIFTYARNLQTLTLDLLAMDTYFSSLEALNPRSLRRLEIKASREETIILDKILPLLPRLDELRLTGNRSRWTSMSFQNRPSPPGTTWKMTRLRIHCLDTTLLQYCPELRELELYWPSRHPTENRFAFREILTCTKLETLKFLPADAFPQLRDLPEVLTSLRRLKRLTFSAYSMEDVEFLCALDELPVLPTDPVTAQMTERSASSGGSRHEYKNKAVVLPLLEHLNITMEDLPTDINNSSRLHRRLSLILESRTLLRTIIVRKFEFDPRELFKKDWACKDLEALSLEFSWTLSTLPSEERVGLWRHVYCQIGTLSKLKSLMLWCAGLEMGDDSGIEALAGASGLERLALADELSGTWSREKLEKLLLLFPKLTTLCLDPLENKKEVAVWLRECGRPIELTTYGDMRQLLDTNIISPG